MLALVGVVVGAVLGGGAQIVAGWLADKRAHRRWLREQRVSAYQAVLEQTDGSLRALYSEEEWPRSGPIQNNWTGGLEQFRSSVELFGAPSVARAREELSSRFNDLSELEPGVDDTDAEMRAIEQARDAYLSAVRADLGVE